jgi:hypothetical protein
MERKISWDGTTKTSISGSSGLFALDNGAALILDNYITLDGKNTAIIFPSNDANCSMIYMKSAHLRMKTGSKITSFTGLSTPVVKTQTSPSITGSITLEGGEISGNTGTGGSEYDVYIPATGAAPAGYTFTMSGGAIKNNTGKGGVYLADNVRGTMSGGEISGYITSGSGYGVYTSATGTQFSMSGGTISGNNTGIQNDSKGRITLTGGTISNNNTTGIYNIYGAVILDGPALISDSITCKSSSTTFAYIYLGSNFSINASITVNLVGGSNLTNFNKSWGSETGGVFLKGGTPDDPGGITQGQLDKFTLNKAYYGSSSLTEISGGSFTKFLQSDTNFGVAKWTTE